MGDVKINKFNKLLLKYILLNKNIKSVKYIEEIEKIKPSKLNQLYIEFINTQIGYSKGYKKMDEFLDIAVDTVESMHDRIVELEKKLEKGE